MAMVLNEEQQLLKDSARDFIADNAPVTALRKLRDEKEPDGFSRDLWRSMVEMGWAGVAISEEYGGLDFGFQGLGLIMEEAGRTLTASPLLSTVVLGASAIDLGGSDLQKNEILPAVAAGDMLLALAVEEGSHHAPYDIALSATSDGDGYCLTGEKKFVIDGHVADKIVVAARTNGESGDRDGITLFLVDADVEGLARTRLSMVDNRNLAHLSFDNVKVDAASIVGEGDKGADTLDRVLDRGRIALAAEMYGSMCAVFEMTLDYLKERRQFGQLIGSFQSLQHRAAQMFSQIELTKSALLEALTAEEAGDPSVPVLASLVKATANETLHLVTSEGIQMHGGIGMTDEHDVGLYLKRARVTEQTFGSTAFHRNRYAALCGY